MNCKLCNGIGATRSLVDREMIDRPCPECMDEASRFFPLKDPIPLVMPRQNCTPPPIRTLDNLEALEMLYAEICEQSKELSALADRCESSRKACWLMLQETRKKHKKDNDNGNQSSD